MDKVVTKVKRVETRNKPAMMLEKSILALESIDVHILEKLEKEELEVVRNKMEVIKAHLLKIEDSIQKKYSND